MKRLYSISWIGSQLPCLALALTAVVLFASGFTYKPAVPGRKLIFPRDHSSHPDFKTEWWYYTGHLETDGGKSYGYQVTFFRAGLRDRQSDDKENPPLFTDLYLAHFALSDKQEKRLVFHERVNRGYAGKAGAATDRYLVWNENWKVEAKNGAHEVFVEARDASLSLKLVSLKPPVLHGQNGFSRK
jgi:predicted secreted hydrolase